VEELEGGDGVGLSQKVPLARRRNVARARVEREGGGYERVKGN